MQGMNNKIDLINTPKLQMDPSGKKYLKTILNLVSLFQMDENLHNLFIFNEFSGTIEYSRNAIWHDVEKGQELRDKDIVFVQYYFAHNKLLEMGIDKIINAITKGRPFISCNC